MKEFAEVDKQLGVIRLHPEYSNCVKVKHLGYMREESDRHSYLMEQSGLNHKSYDRHCEGFRNLESGWKYLLAEGVSVSSLSSLGHIVQPFDDEGKRTPAGFRKSEVSFGPFFGVQSVHTPSKIDELVWLLNECSELHPIARASEAHLGMVMIHPYVDGNGRTARLLQNFCLEQRDYPPAVIIASEKDHYLEVLNQVIQSRNKGESSWYQPDNADWEFRKFIANRVLEGAYSLRKILDEKRTYVVFLDKVTEKGQLITLTDKLKSSLSRRQNGLGISTSVRKRGNKRTVIEVMGDVSLDQLNSFLSRESGKGEFGYAVSPVRYG